MQGGLIHPNFGFTRQGKIPFGYTLTGVCGSLYRGTDGMMYDLSKVMMVESSDEIIPPGMLLWLWDTDAGYTTWQGVTDNATFYRAGDIVKFEQKHSVVSLLGWDA